MSFNLQSGKTFEETVETLFKVMGYNTKPKTVLHTRSAHISAVMHHPKGKQKLLIECQSNVEAVGIQAVQQFCSKVAHAREKAEADTGVLISTTGFSEEAVAWCTSNCSFVKLKTYSQVISRTSNIRKLLRKFHRHQTHEAS
ncbi:MAG: restriction endonuclease [Candidatus Bathyarchaeia archaeon]